MAAVSCRDPYVTVSLKRKTVVASVGPNLAMH